MFAAIILTDEIQYASVNAPAEDVLGVWLSLAVGLFALIELAWIVRRAWLRIGFCAKDASLPCSSRSPVSTVSSDRCARWPFRQTAFSRPRQPLAPAKTRGE